MGEKFSVKRLNALWTIWKEIGTFMAILKKLSPELVKEAIQIEKAYKDKERE